MLYFVFCAKLVITSDIFIFCGHTFSQLLQPTQADGFLSNAKDEGLLVSKAWQEKTARKIAAGVVAYLAVGEG